MAVRSRERRKQLKQSASLVRVAESKYSFLYDAAQILRQRLAMGVCCNGGIEERLINESKDALGYIEALHSNAVEFDNTVRGSFRGSFVAPAQWLQTIFTQKVAAVSMTVNKLELEALIELRWNIFECEAAAMCRLDRVVCCDLSFPETGAAVSEAGKNGEASEVGPSK